MARTRNVYPTDEIAHLWMHQTQDSARNPQGNFYFSGATIFSYGSHFPIAKLVTGAKGEQAVLFTERKYSNTTAKHVGLVHQAIPNEVPYYYCYNPLDQLSKISQDKGKEVEELLAKLGMLAQPEPKYPKLKKARQKFAGVDEPGGVLAGERLCIHPSGTVYHGRSKSLWMLTHQGSGYSISGRLTKAQARAMLHKLDSCEILDKIGADGSMPPKVREQVFEAVRKAEEECRGLADLNRHPAAIAKLYRSAEYASNNANEFNEFFGFAQRFLFPSEAAITLEPLVDRWEEGAAARSAQARAAADSRRAERYARWSGDSEKYNEQAKLTPEQIVEMWRNGERIYRNISYLPTMLRISGDEVETSLGARFPVTHAVKALRFVRLVKAKGEAWHSNGHTIHLGHYKLDEIDAEGNVKAGCHRVSYEEIERIGPMLEELAQPLVSENKESQ